MKGRSFLPAFITVSALLAIMPASAADLVGLRLMTVVAPERRRTVEVALWYPAGGRGPTFLVGDNKVFEGVPAIKDAPVAEGAFPVVLMSHGGLRAAPNMTSWLASRLAAGGSVVAVVNPPALGAGGASDATREISLRPADLSATLTALERDPALAGHVRPDRVGAVGFFLGGTSVLALAGARLDTESYRRTCDRDGVGLDCAWFAKSGVDLHKVEAAGLARSHLDTRVRIAVAVDPELAADFTRESLARIAIPVELINLGEAGAIRPGLNAAGLKNSAPSTQYRTLPGATPFSSFSLCKPDGAKILLNSGDDDAVCRDGQGRTREEVHAELAYMIGQALRQHLRDNP